MFRRAREANKLWLEELKVMIFVGDGSDVSKFTQKSCITI